MKNRNREHDLLTWRLIAAGCRVTTGEEAYVEPDITIEARDPTDNQVFDLHPRGGIGYIFHVKITNRAYRSLFISDFMCRTLWEDPHFTWLQDIRQYRPESEEYRHPGGRHAIGKRVKRIVPLAKSYQSYESCTLGVPWQAVRGEGAIAQALFDSRTFNVTFLVAVCFDPF